MRMKGGARVRLFSGSAKPSLASAFLALMAALLVLRAPAAAQGSHDAGTPAESKGGTSSSSTYAPDKLETVNLANGNLSISLPLVTVGGRGSAAFTLSLSYNSKVWSSSNTVEAAVKDQFGHEAYPAITHYYAKYDDPATYEPNRVELGGGWSINMGPAFKVRSVDIDRINPGTCTGVQSDDGAPCGYKYILTKAWLVLPDGSEVELRDSLTDGAPALTLAGQSGTHQRVDRYRGRVWHSTDGSFVTVVLDEGQTMAPPGIVSGWVFLADGSRLRMEYGSCTKIIDRNGNFVMLRDPLTGAAVYTDQLGRQVSVSEVASGVNVIVKGYGGASDRVVHIDTGVIGAEVGGVADNLRADFRSLLRPFTAGDHWKTREQGDFEHTITGPHTDLFSQSESEQYGGVRVDEARPVTRVQLLDGRSVRFRYNQYGEVAEVVYPGGGVSRIDYAGGSSSLCGGFAPFNDVLDRRVVKRRLLTDGANVDATWLYGGGSSSTSATIEAHEGDGAAGALLLWEKHYFLESAGAQYQLCSPTRMNGTGYAKWGNSREYKVERQTGTGTQVTAKGWEQRAPVVWAPDVGLSYNAYDAQHGQEQPQNDPRVAWEETTLENGKKGRTEYTYDDFNNVTLVKEYDLGGTDGGTGALLRQTARKYVGGGPTPAYNGYCYTNLNPLDSSCGSAVASDPTTVIYQRRLLLSEEVKDGADTREAYAEYEYDNYRDANWATAAPEVNAGMTGYDGARFAALGFDQTRQPRGNVTSLKAWSEGAGGGEVYATSYSRYDNAGNVVATKTPSAMASPTHVVSTVSYTDDFGDGTNPGANGAGPNGATYAFPTLATNPLGQQAKTQYSYTLGAATGVRDANGVVARTEYDAVGRPARTTSAVGLAEQAVSETGYPTATENVARVSRQLDATRWVASKTEFDGFDRPVLAASSEDGQHASQATFTIFAKTVYDALGRVQLVTNPYRAEAATTDGWTRTTYDLAGRVKDVASFAGGASTLPPDAGCASADGCTGAVVTTYSSEQTTVRDQANKQRRSTADGLWRLKSVEEMYEYPAAGVYASTTYDYDARGNLKTVTQGEQTRSFAYDGLSRLKSATNPEVCSQGESSCDPVPVTYDYYANGSLYRKIDARGVVTAYTYDAVNRVTGRSYMGEAGAVTPAVSYTYDDSAVVNSKGHLTKVSSSVSTYSYTAYDAVGRVRGTSQMTDGVTYAMPDYKYDLAGNLVSEQYPSGRVIETQYDAAGRVAGAKNQAMGLYYAGAAATDTSNRIRYTSGGAVSAVKLGNGLWEHTLFNSRLQPTQIGLGASAADSSMLKLDYGYGVEVSGTLDPTRNNGNLRSQAITVPGAATPLVQTYLYDALNRLESAEEKTGTASTWKQVYSYDRYGNRGFATGTTSPSIQVDSVTNLPVADPVRNPAFDPATNRIKVTAPGQGDYRYDSAGNLLCEPGRQCVQGQSSFTPYYAYDAENKMKFVGGGYESGGTSYTYDGDGRRVRKATYNGEVTVFVYDAAGRAVAEYSNIVENKGTRYLTQDHLGSTRVVTDAQGNAHSNNGAGGGRHDYLPFGEELSAATGGRGNTQGYGATDNLRQKFTEKERDNESGLDYYGARYYGSSSGRFTGVDPIFTTLERLIDPQRLNLYAYARNNPLRFIDPNGMDLQIVAENEDEARERFRLLQLGLKKKDRSHVQFFVGDGKNGYEKGKFYVLADEKYKTDSGNFKAVEKIANDRGATAALVLLKTGEPMQAYYGMKEGDKVVLKSAKDVIGTDVYLDKQFLGWTTMPLGNPPVPDESYPIYSPDNRVRAHVLSDQTDVEVVKSMFHELAAHVFLSNVGRDIPMGSHGRPQVENEVKRAEAEAARNFKQQ